MPRAETRISIGGLRVPALALGVAVSVAAHVGFVAALGLTRLGDPAETPELRRSRGVPLEVVVLLEAPAEPVPSSEAAGSAPPAEETPSDDAPPPVERDAPATAEPDHRALVSAVASAAESALQRVLSRLERRRASSASESAIEPTRPEERTPPPRPDIAPRSDRRSSAASPEARPSAGSRRAVEIIDVPQPIYPTRARRRGWEGTVTLAITVGPGGSAVAVAVVESSGHAILDEAAIGAAERGRFRPARRDGRAVSGDVALPFEFRLR